ncbi:hypothetical protein TrRE_jg5122 [Triparma retinervis]|uniref:Uncharacterized protein n=1 Tax=Triparma retinervis TaxID=2557542 RepID=A0A9W7ABN8_9STRA|nr:hypothetical protein TrRE_jg5122 [Triparma retinervis]
MYLGFRYVEDILLAYVHTNKGCHSTVVTERRLGKTQWPAMHNNVQLGGPLWGVGRIGSEKLELCRSMGDQGSTEIDVDELEGPMVDEGDTIFQETTGETTGFDEIIEGAVQDLLEHAVEEEMEGGGDAERGRKKLKTG